MFILFVLSVPFCVICYLWAFPSPWYHFTPRPSPFPFPSCACPVVLVKVLVSSCYVWYVWLWWDWKDWFIGLRFALDELRECHHLAYPTEIKVVSELWCDTKAQYGSSWKMDMRNRIGNKRGRHTLSGLSVGWTRLPSKRNRTELGALPCLSQKASINFFNWVERLILKKTSLLLSVTLMFKCSETGTSGFSPAGLPSFSDIWK